MKMQLRLMTAILATGIFLGAPMDAAAQTESVSTAPASATTIAVLNLDGAYPELANAFSLFGGLESWMSFGDLLATVTKA